MTFSTGGQFEGGRVRTRKGGVAAGGGVGIVGIVAYLIYQFTGVDVAPVLDSLTGGAGVTAGSEFGEIAACSAEEGNANRDCRLNGTVQALDAFWSEMVPAQGTQFAQPAVESFEGATSTGCGDATSSTGPFYCPADQTIYLDLGFFDVLQSQYGASGGNLAEMYVVAHEYGHHVQNLLGTMDTADRQETGATSDGVRLELQADCYAGLWARDAVTRIIPSTEGTDNEIAFLSPLTQDELNDAFSATEAVGDDHIQEQSGVGVNSDTWTHGSSEQRTTWFVTGYNEGTLTACDTFAADTL